MSVENEETKTETTEDKTEQTPVEFLEEGLNEIFSEETETEEVVEDNLSDTEDSGDKKEPEGEEKVETDDSQKVEKELIPQVQVDVARKLGFSDDEIVKLAEDSPERLDSMVKLYSEPAVPQREDKTVEVVKGEERAKPTQIDHITMEDLGELEPDAAKVAVTLVEGQNKLIDILNKQNEQISTLGEQTSAFEKKNHADATAKIDTVFDNASEHIPELGKIESLTATQAKVRQKVYGMAKVIEHTDGLTESNAIEEAIYLFGLSKVDLEKVEQEAEERVKEKINTNKKSMSPRPGGKKSLQKDLLGKKAAIEHLQEGLKEIFG